MSNSLSNPIGPAIPGFRWTLAVICGLVGLMVTLGCYVHVTHLIQGSRPGIESEASSYLTYLWSFSKDDPFKGRSFGTAAHSKWEEETRKEASEAESQIRAKMALSSRATMSLDESAIFLSDVISVPIADIQRELQKRLSDPERLDQLARQLGVPTTSLLRDSAVYEMDLVFAARYLLFYRELQAGELIKQVSDWDGELRINDEGRRKLFSSPLTKHKFAHNRLLEEMHVSAGPAAALGGFILFALAFVATNRGRNWGKPLAWTVAFASLIGVVTLMGHIAVLDSWTASPKSPSPLPDLRPVESPATLDVRARGPRSNPPIEGESQESLRARARTQAQGMCDAMENGKFAEVVGYFPDWVIKSMGGNDAVVKLLKDTAPMLGTMTLHQVGQVAAFGQDAIAIIPTTQQMNIKGTPCRMEGYVVGLSADSGMSWKFVAGSDGVKEEIKRASPHLAIELRFPQRRQFLGKPGETPMEMVEVEGEWVPVGAFRDRVERAVKKIEEGDALYERGRRYYAGDGVPQDWDEAFKWFRKAVEVGHLRAQVTLGICHLRGKGTPRDPAEAVRCFRKAADRDSAAAQSFLARCYRDGEGVPQDLPEARRWYLKAAANGDAGAKKALESLDK